MKYTKSLAVLMCAAAAACVATPVSAGVIGQPVSLAALTERGATVQVGDKLFSDFSYITSGLDMPTAGQVNVIPITDAYGNFGIRFQGAFQDKPGGGASDALISYRVTVLDENLAISDAHILGNPDVVGVGAMNVVETWSQNGDTKIKIWDIKPGDTQLLDAVDFSPNTYKYLDVQKDILADAGDAFINDLPNFSYVTMSFVDQTFSQTAVPEPMTLSMLGLGAAGLLMRRSRKA